ncbi:nucleoside triphosphate pyrophosphohydrolase [Glacieibacterium sp.]|uniref:nucleoside triphosphate pyrophosphohydrolase n=1 Tax=Glacieibacterium sp. TaxID=2860237 RepID=UPI003AFFF6F9
MARLRDPETGCPWDVAQSFATIAPYTIEEAYEVAQAIADNDMTELRDELGDLLLQVVFHSRIAEEAGLFALNDVVAAIVDKMTRRHPHVFADAVADVDAVTQKLTWETLKAREKPRDSALSGVATALPALMRADKLQRRAARTGFDWPDPSGARDKIIEELAEFDAADSVDHRTEEAGDLLFAVVNLLRHHEIDPETALRSANAKFERRFRAMETSAGDAFPSLDLEAKERLWDDAKAAERS